MDDELSFWRTIPLTRGYRAMVDVADYEELAKHRWSAHYQPSIRGYYARRSVKQNGKYKDILMHRVITSAPPGLEVDHINHDGLNNCRWNLRLVTRNGQSANRRDQAKHGPGIEYRPGTRFQKRPYRAQIMHNKRRISLGMFATEAEARAAREAYLKRAALAEEGEK